MSKQETKPEPKKVATTKKYEFFDENLTLQSKEVPVEYTEVADLENAVKFLSDNPDLYIDAANAVIRKQALSNARSAAGASGGINREVLMEFIKPYREMPQFAGMISATDKRKATAEEWNAQTQAILDQIKNIPFIMNGIKERSKAVDQD